MERRGKGAGAAAAAATAKTASEAAEAGAAAEAAAAAAEAATAQIEKLEPQDLPRVAVALAVAARAESGAAVAALAMTHAVLDQLPEQQRDACRYYPAAGVDRCTKGNKCPWRHPTDGLPGARPADACLGYAIPRKRRQQKKRKKVAS